MSRYRMLLVHSGGELRPRVCRFDVAEQAVTVGERSARLFRGVLLAAPSGAEVAPHLSHRRFEVRQCDERLPLPFAKTLAPQGRCMSLELRDQLFHAFE